MIVLISLTSFTIGLVIGLRIGKKDEETLRCKNCKNMTIINSDGKIYCKHRNKYFYNDPIACSQYERKEN